MTFFVVDPFDTVKAYFKDKHFSMLDQLYNDLNNRFNTRKSLKFASDIDQLLVSGVHGNYERCQDLFLSNGYKQYAPVIDSDLLKSEFRYVSMCINKNKVVSFTTLVDELKLQDMEHLWLVAKNYMTLVKIMLTLMPTSISAERSFSALDRIKGKLRNCMGDERLNDQMQLTFNPDLAKTIDLVALCNRFVSATSYKGTREKCFGKFVPSDLSKFQEHSKESYGFEDVREANSGEVVEDRSAMNLPNLQDDPLKMAAV